MTRKPAPPKAAPPKAAPPKTALPKAALPKAAASEAVCPTPSALGPIVSSAHLASGGSAGLSEIEFGLILAQHAFQRWMVRCTAAAGMPGMATIDVLVLHIVNHRARPKRLADICLVLNIEDTHVVTYALRKLEKLGLVASKREGKEKLVEVTSAGSALCARYGEVREELLVKAVKSTGLDEATMRTLAGYLRGLSGQYDQAARAASTL